MSLTTKLVLVVSAHAIIILLIVPLVMFWYMEVGWIACNRFKNPQGYLDNNDLVSQLTNRDVTKFKYEYVRILKFIKPMK